MVVVAFFELIFDYYLVPCLIFSDKINTKISSRCLSVSIGKSEINTIIQDIEVVL